MHWMTVHSCLDHIERVHHQDLGYTSHRTGGELVDEGKRLVGRHFDRVLYVQEVAFGLCADCGSVVREDLFPSVVVLF